MKFLSLSLSLSEDIRRGSQHQRMNVHIRPTAAACVHIIHGARWHKKKQASWFIRRKDRRRARVYTSEYQIYLRRYKSNKIAFARLPTLLAEPASLSLSLPSAEKQNIRRHTARAAS
jgi:hypothetical protein